VDLAHIRRPLLIGLVAILGVLVVAQRLQGAEPEPDRLPGRGSVAASTVVAAGVVVHVAGAVVDPGLYTLDAGTRVADAVREAGGGTRRADLGAINLAAPLVDGEYVLVPRRDDGGPTGAAAKGRPKVAPLQLSAATVEQLDALPGIGPATAQKIVEYREAHGTFRSVEELVGVPGIGPAKLEALRGLLVP
jgi:competence protein ComEA